MRPTIVLVASLCAGGCVSLRSADTGATAGPISAVERPTEARSLPPGAEAISLLGEPLAPLSLSPEIRQQYEERLAEARVAHDRSPGDADAVIWLGRRTAYLGRYRDAIDIFTRGIAAHPGDARMYRHRGHRFITVRELDRAVADLETAARLMSGKPDEVEPDGIPNARNIPTSTLHSNIRYHLGLARYLKGDFDRALTAYRDDLQAATNADMQVATSHWLYMTLRRLGRDTEAVAVLAPIRADMKVIENGSYHRLLLLYKGVLPPDSLVPSSSADRALDDATTGYGLGNWHLYNGRRADAERVFRRVLAGGQWPSFGYLAAEVEIARGGGKAR